MRYKTEEEIKSLVERFENGTIARAEWRHAEHLTVALVYLSNYEYDAALAKMRGGIFNLLKAFGVDISKETPYHETLTVFWLKIIEDYKNSRRENSLLKNCNEIIEKFDKDFPLKFYSRELLFSKEARARFVEPDLL